MACSSNGCAPIRSARESRRVDTTFLNRLQGRIIALELLMDGVLMNLVRTTADPAATLAGVRQAMIAGLQLLERPVGDEEDEIWDFAMQALEMRFGNVENRLQRQKRG
jgi:hypothetical protein